MIFSDMFNPPKLIYYFSITPTAKIFGSRVKGGAGGYDKKDFCF